jgi:hypothetical protein
MERIEKYYRQQIKTIITYIRTTYLRTLVRKLTEHERQLLHQVIAHIPPLQVYDTIKLYDQVVVYNMWLRKMKASEGHEFVAEVVAKSVDNAKQMLVSGKVGEVARMCFEIILAVEIPAETLKGEGNTIQQAKQEAYALIQQLPAKQRSKSLPSLYPTATSYVPR